MIREELCNQTTITATNTAFGTNRKLDSVPEKAPEGQFEYGPFVSDRSQGCYRQSVGISLSLDLLLSISPLGTLRAEFPYV